MMLGLSLSAFTVLHVLISLVGIASGLGYVLGLAGGKSRSGWATLFLVTTIATSVTGFGFPFEKILPSHIVGVLSLVVLAIALVARYALHLAGFWRRAYTIACVVALYFNTFVLVVQLFNRVPVLRSLAPTQTEAPFAIAQLAVLVMFVVLGRAAVRRGAGASVIRA
jgi:hypothetical protein